MRILAFTLCQVIAAQSQDDSIRFDKITSLVKCVGSGDRRQIVRLIKYPLGRPYPLKPIRSPQECLLRFDEVFDETLITDMKNSDLQEDWGRVGWRGIIFKSGSLWLDDDYRIKTINHETGKTKALRAAAIQKQKLRLPLALRDFDEPELEWKTSKYVIRVDRKGTKYRLVVFDNRSPAKVLHVFQNGVFQFNGNMGAFNIDWQSGGKTYRVSSENPDSGDGFFIYDSLVEPTEWPEHPNLEQKRLVR